MGEDGGARPNQAVLRRVLTGTLVVHTNWRPLETVVPRGLVSSTVPAISGSSARHDACQYDTPECAVRGAGLLLFRGAFPSASAVLPIAKRPGAHVGGKKCVARWARVLKTKSSRWPSVRVLGTSDSSRFSSRKRECAPREQSQSRRERQRCLLFPREGVVAAETFRQVDSSLRSLLMMARQHAQPAKHSVFS